MLPFKDDLTGIGRLELHDGAGEGGLAATGLPDEPEYFTFFKREANAIDRADCIRNAAKGSLSNRKVGVNINEFEEGHRG